MNENNFLTIVVIIAVCVALVNMGITINKIGDIKELTGYATDTGQANLTIESSASVSFVTSTVDWGDGSVTSGSSAWMDTEGNNGSGNWTVVSQGLTLENQGNCNVTFTLTTSNIATSFIGGSGAEYEIKLTDNETDACGTGLNSLSTYTNATAQAQSACTNMSYEGTRNALDIDINITVPIAAIPGAKGSIITATAECI